MGKGNNMSLRYTPQSIQIKIFISKATIDSTDTLSIFETTTDPSGAGTLIAKNLRGVEVTNDPSITGDSYLFQHTTTVNTPDTYSFYYIITDSSGNESDSVNSFSIDVCLVPVTPDPIPFSDLNFTGNSSGAVNLVPNLVIHYKMNDALATDVILDASETIDAIYRTANTEDKSVTGKINQALNFVRADSNYLDTTNSLSGIFINSFSINFWIKPVDAQPASARYSWGASNSTGNSLCALAYSASGFAFSYRAGGGSIVSELFTNPMVDDQWHMGTLTMEEINASVIRVKMWVDNVIVGDSGLVVADMDAYGTVGGAPADVYFAALNSAGTDTLYHDGPMDDIRIFNKILTTAERFYLWNNEDGTESNANDLSVFQTVWNYPVFSPSAINEDGDYAIGDENIGVDPVVGEYLYFRTYTSCNLESGASAASGDSGETSSLNLPGNDPENLFINNKSNGTFQLIWNYNAPKSDSTTHFNIYFMIISDPSATDENPSVEGLWILDGRVAYHQISNRFSFTSRSFEHGTIVDFKVVPLAVGYGERDNEDIETGIADNRAPSTEVIDFITITLL